MQSTDIKCTSHEFTNLTCPYTGKPLEVYMLVTPGRAPLFHVPNPPYTVAQPYESAEKAYEQWNRVDGVGGLKTGKPVTCAYSGALLSVKRSDYGYYYEGGYDPRMFYERATFLKKITARDGVSPYDSAEDTRIEAPPPDSEPIFKREFDTDPSDDALKIAADTLQKHKDELPTQASVTVSMAVNKKGKGKTK